MRAGVALREIAFQLAVRAGSARRAVAFHLAVRARSALRAAVFPLAVRAGGALRAIAFQLAVRAGIALRAVAFQLVMCTPFLSHLTSDKPLPETTRDCYEISRRICHARPVVVVVRRQPSLGRHHFFGRAAASERLKFGRRLNFPPRRVRPRPGSDLSGALLPRATRRPAVPTTAPSDPL